VEIHPKIAIFTAGGAFLLSLLLSLISGAPLFLCFLRALIFAVIFYILAAAVFNLCFDTLPEDTDSPAREVKPGETINISLGGNIPDFADDDSEPEKMTGTDGARGNGQAGKEDNAPDRGLEQKEKPDYNSGSSSPLADGTDGNDLDSDKPEFVSGMPGIESAGMDGGDFGKDQPAVKGSLDGDFNMSVGKLPDKNIELSDLGPDINSKKVADAIHTLLIKDKEG